MSKSLNCRTSMTEKLVRSEREDAVAKRERILEELVPCLPVPREER